MLFYFIDLHLIMAEMEYQNAMVPSFSPLELFVIEWCILPCANFVTCWGWCDPFGWFN
jgi:hypothetical protein